MVTSLPHHGPDDILRECVLMTVPCKALMSCDAKRAVRWEGCVCMCCAWATKYNTGVGVEVYRAWATYRAHEPVVEVDTSAWSIVADVIADVVVVRNCLKIAALIHGPIMSEMQGSRVLWPTKLPIQAGEGAPFVSCTRRRCPCGFQRSY